MTTVVETWDSQEGPLLTTNIVKSQAKLTFEQALQESAGEPFELVDGKIVFKTHEAKHADARALLCGALGKFLMRHPIGRVRLGAMLLLWPDNPYGACRADLSVVLNENIREEQRYATRAPDLAIEIVSRHDGWTELFEKARVYLEKGSRVVWIADPYQQAVVVITPNEQRWVRDTLTCPEVLPGFSINVQDILNWPTATTKATE